jgi:UPF0716 protein FxsA
MISGAAIAFAAILLIIPGFATDILGFLIIFPISRNLFLKKFFSKFKSKEKEDKKNNLSIFILEHIYKIYSEEKNHEFIN